MMTYIHSLSDRELLELAAEAVYPDAWEWNGIRQRIEVIQPTGWYKNFTPLGDLCDAMRLAVNLRISVNIKDDAVWCQRRDIADVIVRPDEMVGATLEDAICRAITLAAAYVALAKRGGVSTAKG